VRDYERLPQMLADLHVVALVCIMLKQVTQLLRGCTRLNPLRGLGLGDEPS